MTAQQRTSLADEFDRVSRIAVAEPVAVVGIGCRFPGDVDGPESFWDFLVAGRNAISTVPADRWDAEAFYHPDPLTPGRMTTKWGGFVPDVAGFDAEFFGITPREAAAMDPQQRMLLEVAWEALEHAGIPPDSLGGTRTAVMMGVYFNEYQSMLAASPQNVDAYSGPEMHTASRWVASPTCWDYGVRRSRWTPPARRRWWLCTWRVRV